MSREHEVELYYLREKVVKLQKENDYLRKNCNISKFSMLEEPPTINSKDSIIELRIAAEAGFNSDDYGYHTYIKVYDKEKGMLVYRYLVDRELLLLNKMDIGMELYKKALYRMVDEAKIMNL